MANTNKNNNSAIYENAQDNINNPNKTGLKNQRDT